MEENKKQLNSDSLESISGGIHQLTEQEKNRWRKIIRNAKQQGATLEEFLQGDESPSLRNFIVTAWDVIGANDYHNK